MEARLRALLFRVFEVLFGAAVSALVVGAIAQVTLRYAFAAPPSWIEPISVLLMIWLAWLGAAYLWLKHAHISVDLFLGRIGRHGRRALALAFELIMAALGLAVFLSSFATFHAFAGIELGDLPVDIAAKFQPIAAGALALSAAALLNLWRALAAPSGNAAC